MAGGQGTRFWPASREKSPKQFLKFFGSKSLFQLTVERLKLIAPVEDIFVVCCGEYLPLVLEQAPELSEKQVIVEPVPRNTAPGIGLAAIYLNNRFPGEMMGVFPADHLIRDENAFRKAILFSLRLADAGHLVTFGIRPGFPATGYGYLELGESISREDGMEAYKVAAFKEKPAPEKARSFVESGRFLWNSGMFVWSIPEIIGSIEKFLPGLHQVLNRIEGSFEWGEEEKRLFAGIEPVSIDYGVMEKSGNVVVVPCDLQWNDVGDWNAAAEIIESSSVARSSDTPETLTLDSDNCFVFSQGKKKVAIAGVSDLILVETEDAILVCNRNRSQDVGKIVKRLREEDPELV